MVTTTSKHILELKTIQVFDLVDFYRAQANKNALPDNIQKVFTVREGGYYLRGCRNFKGQAEHRPTSLRDY